ncbi:hypothetical protein Bca101_061954 [Brassica carinata]
MNRCLRVCVINHVYIVWYCFIMHPHSTISEQEATLLKRNKNHCDTTSDTKGSLAAGLS